MAGIRKLTTEILSHREVDGLELNLAVSFGISVFVYFEPPRLLACLRRQGRFFARGMAHDEAI